MQDTIKALREKADDAKLRYAYGYITRETALEEIAPYIEEANKRGKDIAKKHNMKFRPITFI